MIRLLAISTLAVLFVGTTFALISRSNKAEEPSLSASANRPSSPARDNSDRANIGDQDNPEPDVGNEEVAGQADREVDRTKPAVAPSPDDQAPNAEQSVADESILSDSQSVVARTPVMVESKSAPSLHVQLNVARLRLASAEAAAHIAQQDATIRDLQQQRDLATATRELNLLQLDRKAYREGEAARLRDDLVGSIEIGRRRAALAKTRMDWSERLAEKGLVSQYGLEADREAMQTAQEKLQVDMETLEAFDASAHQRQLAILQRQVQLAETEVERIRRTARVQQTKHKIGLAMRQAACQLARASVARLKEQTAEKEAPTTRNASTTRQTRQRQPVRANITRRLPIQNVVAHGTMVDPGHVLVELDATALQHDRQEHEQALVRALTELEQAQEEVALIKSQSELDHSQSELAVKAAQLALVEYTEGEFPRRKQTIVEKIDKMRDEVEAAERRLKWSERVMKKGYLTPMKLEEDQLALTEQQHALAQLQHELRIIEEHTYAREVAALQSGVEQAEAENERTRTLAAAKLKKAEAKLKAAEAAHRLYQAESERLAQAISNCRIIAPARGRALHEAPTADSDSFVAPQVGTMVQPDQILLTLVTDADLADDQPGLRPPRTRPATAIFASPKMSFDKR